MEPAHIGAGNPLRVLSAGSVRAALLTAAQAYNAKTGCAFTFTFDTAGGVEKRAGAEAPDVFASSMDSLRKLEASGLLGGPARAVGSARMALGVRTGERAPDISTVEAFKAAVRGARKIARGDPAGGGTGAIHLLEVFTRLGLFDEVAAKSVLRVGGVNVMRAVAEGLADFGITQSTEIVPVKGVEIAAWLPDEIQSVTAYGVAAGAKSAQPGKVRDFLAWLAAPEAARLFAEAGFFPA
ncbi:MAG: molybdate ABC transporter substrate-binding protein [Beijerinckiaceae bacterium]